MWKMFIITITTYAEEVKELVRELAMKLMNGD